MEQSSLRERIHNFFENPSTPLAYTVQGFIVVLILASVGLFVVDFFYPVLYARYAVPFEVANWFILVAFTIEYVLKVGTAPKRFRFALRPFSIIDFLAIFPNYIELFLPLVIDTTELRVLRLVRLLRFARLLRALKLFRYENIFKKVFSYKQTILENIIPVILLFAALKGVIWILEAHGLWVADENLGNLFGIVGFALGIVLGQKIQANFQKFAEVEEAVVRIRSTLWSLQMGLNAEEKNLGDACVSWSKVFLKLLKDTETNTTPAMNAANTALLEVVSKAQKGDLMDFSTSIVQDADFCMSKRIRLTPKAYDTLLHQSTMLYLALVAIFIPGLTGMISVLLATYMLYGMYNLTQDFDSIIGGEYDLINLDLSELEEFAASKR